MNRIDRYILTEWLKVFVIAFSLILGLLLMEDLYDNLEDLLDWGVSALSILEYYAVLLPSLTPTVLPVALLVSILFSLGNLHRHNELVAMRAAGQSLLRITRSIWFAGIFLSGVLFALSAAVVPWSIEESRELWVDFAFASELDAAMAEPDETLQDVGTTPAVSFYNRTDRRLWFMNRFSEVQNVAYGVTVHQLDANRRETGRIMASRALYDPDERFWTFQQGRRLDFSDETGEVILSLPFDVLGMPDLDDSPRIMQHLMEEPANLSVYQLRELRAALPEDDPRARAHAVRYWSILASPLTLLIVVGIGVPYAVAGVRTNPMVAVSKSLGLFFGYFIVANLLELLGSLGYAPPWLAVAVAPLAMLTFAVYLNRKML
jgi:lipopolysaccharide export system permease protein